MVEAVAEELQAQGLVKLVVDPVLVSTSGDALATAGTRRCPPPAVACLPFSGRPACVPAVTTRLPSAAARSGCLCAARACLAVSRRSPAADVAKPAQTFCTRRASFAGWSCRLGWLVPTESHRPTWRLGSWLPCVAGVAEAIKTHLLPLATIVTPNIPEASKLLGEALPGLFGVISCSCSVHVRVHASLEAWASGKTQLPGKLVRALGAVRGGCPHRRLDNNPGGRARSLPASNLGRISQAARLATRPLAWHARVPRRRRPPHPQRGGHEGGGRRAAPIRPAGWSCSTRRWRDAFTHHEGPPGASHKAGPSLVLRRRAASRYDSPPGARRKASASLCRAVLHVALHGLPAAGPRRCGNCQHTLLCPCSCVVFSRPSQWVLVKGGHLAAAEAADPTHPDDHHGEGPMVQPGTVTDVLFDGKNMIELTERHVK